jgi:hypothetical protein
VGPAQHQYSDRQQQDAIASIHADMSPLHLMLMGSSGAPLPGEQPRGRA